MSLIPWSLYFKGHLENNNLSDTNMFFDVIKFGGKEKSFFPLDTKVNQGLNDKKQQLSEEKLSKQWDQPIQKPLDVFKEQNGVR